MQRSAILPCLPGFNFDPNIGRTNFHRNQIFDKVHEGVYYLAERADRLCNSRYPALYPRGLEQEQPSWLAYDGQRLMFKAFFQETVEERQQAYQIRTVMISFFLEDGTMKITEPMVDNSGLEQGVLVRRQRVPRSRSADHRYYDILDLNIGEEPEIFGRVYKIVDCDRFTRYFLNHMGIPVPDPIEIPQDPYTKLRARPIFPKKPNVKIDTRGDFLKYDRQVLRFYCYWDDTDSENGIIHDLELHYYLADNTIEIKENLPPNSGRDTGSMFLKRMKVPKIFSGLEPIGSADPYTVLNVLGDTAAETYFMVDALNAGKSNTEYYKDNELNIGAEIDVFGRRIVLTDMDSFTKEYYRKKYGVDDFTPLKRPISKEEDCKPVQRYIPPYNGFGTYEDSLGNCFSVMPKAPQMDVVKFMFYDKQGFDSRVLRFRARMVSRIPENEERHFIIRVYLMNDEISIFELTKRNSGFKRCLFQKRMPVMLPNQDIFVSKKPDYYKPEDFYIGAKLNLCGFEFVITSADIYALRYMEIHCDKFKRANAKLIMEKLRQALKPVYKELIQNYAPPPTMDGDMPIVEYRKFREALCKYMGDQITEHEMITIARQYSSHVNKERITREYVRRLMHTELLRLLWDDLDRLEEDLHHWDRGRTGYLPRDTLYSALRGCRIPVDRELLNSTLDHLRKREDGRLDYRDLLEFMNVRIDPVPPLPPINIKTDLWWASEKEPDCGAGIDWCAFIKDLDIKLEDDTPETEAERGRGVDPGCDINCRT